MQDPQTLETDGAGAIRIAQRVGMAPINFSGQLIQLSLTVTNIERASALELVLGDTGFVNHFRFNLKSSQGQQWITNGDPVSFSLSWSPGNYSVVGNPDRSRITDVMLRVADDASGKPVRVDLAGVALVPEPAEYPRGVLSFTFDDNIDTQITEGAPVLDRYNYPATAYVIVEYVDQPGRIKLADLHARQDRGWDIAAHSFTVDSHSRRWTALLPTKLEDDIVDSRAWLMANGFKGYDHCAYPGGSFDSDTLAVTDKYFTSCRTIYQRQREAFLPSNAQKLRVFYVTSGVTLDATKAAIANAITAREWIILVFHDLVETPTQSTDWSKTDFATLVDYVNATGIPVQTVAQLLD